MNVRRRIGGAWAIPGAVLAAISIAGCATDSFSYQNQRAFAEPERAAIALREAADAHDLQALQAIFGPHGQAVLSSGDPVDDRHGREVFAVAMEQGWSLERLDDRTRELVIGHERWPFPIPLVKDSRGWWFDTEAGKWEVLARRIGRNELAAIGALRAYVVAQREYASKARDGRPPGVYAQKVRSDPGRRNGLWWPDDATDDAPSPLGEFAAQAAVDGYEPDPTETRARPYHGYYYRILTEQGSSAPGGAMSYVVDGNMTGGFAMVAYPSEYGNSGIMTFLVGADGVIYEADLGTDTATIAGAIRAYAPDERWTAVRWGAPQANR